jgi:hypothetical protein
MADDRDQAFYLRKAAEYRDKAAATRELLLRHAFTAVAPTAWPISPEAR